MRNKLPQSTVSSFEQQGFIRLPILQFGNLGEAQLGSSFGLYKDCSFVYSQLLAAEWGVGWPKMIHLHVQQMVLCKVGQWETPGFIQQARTGLFTWKCKEFQVRRRKPARPPEA